MQQERPSNLLLIKMMTSAVGELPYLWVTASFVAKLHVTAFPEVSTLNDICSLVQSTTYLLGLSLGPEARKRVRDLLQSSWVSCGSPSIPSELV